MEKVKIKNGKAQVKKSATLLKIYYFSSTFQIISLGLKQIVLLFIETGFINIILSKINFISNKFFFSAICSLIFLQSRDKLFGKRTLYSVHTVGESGAPSLLQKEKRRSAKSEVSKVLFPDIGKITNRVIIVCVGTMCYLILFSPRSF